MITKTTIDRIFDAVLIEDVIGDFVQLKRAGSSFKGLSPFNSERTPSFYVSPAKGIFKDFSSGKGGNAVTFLMELENMTYPEALRYLANKYQIEIEESELTPEKREEMGVRESLSLVNKFAAEYFEHTLWQSDDGKSIGLSYFRERGFTDTTIKKFGLGYAFDKNDSFLKTAEEAGYNPKHFLTLGLTKEGEHGVYDFFRGRVIFPIRNITGKNIAFAGRTLKSDSKVKYLNSPESELYDKSKTLYGIFEAKRGIMANDLCFLVEGYTDVISLHQAGVDYAVASAGTSLTQDQARLIKRYTKNVAILYDGDKAGVKAALRAIDLLLEEGLYVKVVLFPDGHDPDSFARATLQQELFDYLKRAAKDFTDFMVEVLLDEGNDDPIVKAQTSRRMVESLSLISDHITRSVYLSRAAKCLNIPEQALLLELNRLVRKRGLKAAGVDPVLITDPLETNVAVQKPAAEPDHILLEREVARVLVQYGSFEMDLETIDEDGKEQLITVPLAEFVIHELTSEEIEFKSPIYSKILSVFKTQFEEYGVFPGEDFFVKSTDQELTEAISSLISTPYELSVNWSEKHHIYTDTEDQNLKRTAFDPVMRLKLWRVRELIKQIDTSLKLSETEEELSLLLQEKIRLDKLKAQVSTFFGSTII